MKKYLLLIIPFLMISCSTAKKQLPRMDYMQAVMQSEKNVDADSNDALDILYGGLNSALTDPGGDRIVFWDDGEALGSNMAFLSLASNLVIAATTLGVTFAPTSADGEALGTVDLEFSDVCLADGSIIKFGDDQDILVTHDPDDGLFAKSTATTDDNPFVLTLQTGETDIAAADVLGGIYFQAPDEGAGTDAILIAAGIEAVSEGDFAADSNATKLSFKTGSSEVASEKASLSSGGNLYISGNIELGHATDTTLTRPEEGEVDIEGQQIYHEGDEDTIVAATTHAARHAPDGADPIGAWHWSGALTINDSSPAVTDGYIYHCGSHADIAAGSFTVDETYIITAVGTTTFTDIGASANTVGIEFTATGVGAGTGTAIVLIKDFVDNDGDHSAFTPGETMIRVLANDSDCRFDHSNNSHIEGNADTDFQGLEAQQLLIEYLYVGDGTIEWQTQNLHGGYADALTMAIGTARLAYTIAVPQTVSNFDTDDTDYTVGTEITSSLVLIDGINDGDGDSIDLKDAGAGYDGIILTIKVISDVDVNDSFTVDTSEATACVDCPMSGSFVFYNTGYVTLRYEHGVGWHFMDYSHDSTDWAPVLTDGDDGGGDDDWYYIDKVGTPDDPPESNIWFHVKGRRCFIDLYVKGVARTANHYFQIFNLPFTSTDNSNQYSQGTMLWKDGAYDKSPGVVTKGNDNATISIYHTGDYDDEEDYADNSAIEGFGAINYLIK